MKTESLRSYNEALKQLETEEKIYFLTDYVKISKKFINQCQDPRIKIINLSKNAPRTLFTSFFGFFPQLMNIVSQNTEAFLKTQKINWRTVPDQPYLLMDPQKYVFFQTSTGLISLSDKIDIKAYAQKMLLKDKSQEIES